MGRPQRRQWPPEAGILGGCRGAQAGVSPAPGGACRAEAGAGTVDARRPAGGVLRENSP